MVAPASYTSAAPRPSPQAEAQRLASALYQSLLIAPPKRCATMTGPGRERKYSDVKGHTFTVEDIRDHLRGDRTWATTLKTTDGIARSGCRDYDSGGKSVLIAALDTAATKGITAFAIHMPGADAEHDGGHVQLVADIGKRRKDGLEPRSYPIILWLDETTSLLSRSKVAEPLALLIEAIAQEYRKVDVFACASGLIWSASRTGDDSALRDSFASVICHRMKRSQARFLVPTDEAQRVERLGTGQALLWRTSGETTVIGVPNTTAADVVRVAGY